MKASALKVSYSVDAPANWAGTYTSNNDSWSENWTWYKDGKANTVNAPHVTIAFSLSHEVAKTSGEWIGFHVSYPLSKSGKNARFNYKIVNGVAVYSNMTRTGFTDDALAEADEVRSDNYSALNDFAAAFFKAATK